MQNSVNKTVIILLSIIFSMICLVIASVPLYNLFCKVTGYSGTASSSGAVTIGTRLYDVQFNAEDSNSKKISFSTKTKTIETLSGKNNLVIFELTNKSDEDVTLTALYNVLPQKAAQYFVKIECFCYEELTFKANSTSKLPVSFYLDPEIEKDPFLKNIDKITLSYSVHIDN